MKNGTTRTAKETRSRHQREKVMKDGGSGGGGNGVGLERAAATSHDTLDDDFWSCLR